MDGEQRGDEIVLTGILEQVAAGSGVQRAANVFLRVIGGEHQQTRGGRLGPDAARGFDAVQLRHPHIHERDVRLVLAVRGDRRVAIGGFGDDGEARVEFQDSGQAHAHDEMVVGEQQTDGRGGFHGSGTVSEIVVPSAVLSRVREPPILAARRFMPSRPKVPEPVISKKIAFWKNPG